MVRGEELKRLVVDLDGANARVDSWLHSKLPLLSRSKIQQLIKSGKVQLNGKSCRVSTALTEKDELTVVVLKNDESVRLTPVKMELHIIYEDDHLIVINKPAGLSVHPGAGTRSPTLVEGLLGYLGSLSHLYTDIDRPGIVHRLDKDTTGVMVCAKTDDAFLGLKSQFQSKTIKKEYYTLLDGLLPQDEITLENYLARDPKNRLRYQVVERNKKGARYSKSTFQRMKTYGHRFDFVKVTLHTGRTHQIRVHAKYLACPILGDPMYNGPKDLPLFFSKDLRSYVGKSISRQMLHSQKLGFKHPITSDYLEFVAEMPNDFSKLMGILEPYKL